MSELKELIEKFIELDDDLSEKIDEYLETNDDIDEAFEKENEAQIDELNEIYHEIEHGVFNEELIFACNANSDEKEVVALIISDEDDDVEEFVIPVFTDEQEAEIAIEEFKKEFGENEFILDKKTGAEIIADHSEDEDFIGLAINAPQWDFVIASEDVHDCSE
ncbi:MAG: hypothetical protein Q4Q14_05490 [Methanobrevibacter sp.]|nr:hypothetical protein [Methanobrevibacter sp.]